MPSKISISGARGIIGKDLVPSFIERLICAFHRHIPQGSVLLGSDSRLSGEPIIQIAEGILRLLGRDVVRIGKLPTPTICLCTKELGAAGAIAVTASHNPIEWNGLKLIGPDGLFVAHDFWGKFAMDEPFFPEWVDSANIGRGTENSNCARIHLNRVLSLPYIEKDMIRERGFCIAYDGVGGAGPAVIIPFLKELDIEIVSIGEKLDGNFIHPPEPVPANLGLLSELVKSSGADIGFATDPDADRLAIVDENGNPIGEEFTLALAAYRILSQSAGDIVVNLSTSSLVEYVAQKFGGTVHRTPVGEYWVTKRILELRAEIGGEGNGGVIIPQMHPVRDSITAAALILTLMAKTGKKISELVMEFPQKIMLKDKIAFDGDFPLVAEKIIAEFEPAESNRSDGVWFRTGDGFMHIRQSNTEPIIRIIVEENSESEAISLIERAKQTINSLCD